MNKEDYIVLFVVLLFVAGLVFVIDRGMNNIIENSYERGYVSACKDFYKGKLKYDLVTNPDGTREWKKIK